MEQLDLLEERILALLEKLNALETENIRCKERQKEALADVIQENTQLREQLAHLEQANQAAQTRITALILRIKDSLE